MPYGHQTSSLAFKTKGSREKYHWLVHRSGQDIVLEQMHPRAAFIGILIITVAINSASNALNKWLKANFHDGIVVHGFRHAMRDRLRAITCPLEIIDEIGMGYCWVGHSYGEGYGLSNIGGWAKK